MERSASSHKQLQTQVNTSEAKLAHMNELMSKVREHKHNYSEDFGLVVSVPVKELMKELINNPTLFSVDEKEGIVEVFSKSMEMRGLYECLGWSVGMQLNKVKNEMIPFIRRNVDFYSSMIGKNADFQDRWLITKMKMALNGVDGLCSKLENIEHFEYGESESFKLKEELQETFMNDNSSSVIKGEQPMLPEWYFGEYSDIMVEMNRQSFRVYLLGNIIKNLHEHAFNETNKYEPFETSNSKRNESFWAKLLNFFNIRKKSINDNFTNEFTNPVREKRVRISFQRDTTNEHRINLIIENNGNPFKGDVTEIFKKGIGDGEGEHIGLYSAKQFLIAYGASISMFTNNDTEYKVGFLINLPVI